ncbi:MAG: DUF721 domain-containing protein [Paludibacteraceae bacterium]|nr:DUF721 domain-containing protein [Candidatus Colicola coprequi]MCQ2334034.1 DUF721 domain-containing protein [Paludibacteraceae bacterium]
MSIPPHSQSISEAISDFLKDSGLEQTVLEDRMVEKWNEVMGPQVARLTTKVEIRDRVLYAYIHSAALKAQLFDCRFQLVEKLNNSVGGQVIRDIRILG